MPYILRGRRERYNQLLADLTAEFMRGGSEPGELNYIISSLIRRAYPDLNYKKINEIIGVLECAKLEYYRMLAAPYENEKRIINGDV